MTEFEILLKENMASLVRFVNYKVGNPDDAQDIIQEACIAACEKYGMLREKTLFKTWLIRIANNKCNDFFREKVKVEEISLDSLAETDLIGSENDKDSLAVRETIDSLGEKDRQILYLYFFRDLTQKEISRILNLPLGTVKSRLHNAKQKFKEIYPCQNISKGVNSMKKLPDILPEYTIEKSDKPPFSVKCEELVSWAIIPRLNEKTSFGLYYMPSREMHGLIETKVVGEAEIYGIRGVEISAVEHDMDDYYRTKTVKEYRRSFIAQLTDTHSRFLAESHVENGVRMIHTFIDDDEFTKNWGYGEDNCGHPINISPKNIIRRNGNTVTGKIKPEEVDIIGRYTVKINGKEYDTVCVMDINCFEDNVVSEQYLDKNGRTVLWRRFNRNDWAFERYQKEWTEMLPENERLTVNGNIYVHWYDCITDYIL